MGVPGGGVPAWSRALLGMSVKSAAGASNVTTWTVGLPGVHLRLVERPDARALEGAAGGIAEHVRRHVDAVRPDAELRVVVEAAGRVDRVEVPAAADRVAGLRHGEALEVAGRIDDVARAVELKAKSVMIQRSSKLS